MEAVQALIEEGADVKTDGGPALRWAAKLGHDQVVIVLLDADVEVDDSDKNGRTALMGTRHIKTVRALLGKGADVNAKDKKGWSVWMGEFDGRVVDGIKFNPDPKMVRAFLEYGADVNARDKYGRTVLVKASTNFSRSSSRTRIEVMQALLDKDADVNAVDKNGWTALMLAAIKGHTMIMEFLLEKGADVNARTPEGATALSLARSSTALSDSSTGSRARKPVVGILEAAGAEEN